MVKVSMEDMTRAEIKEIKNQIEVAIVPVASTEQHGPHLPMSTDMASVLYIAKKTAERFYPQVVVTPPPVMAGISIEHMNYPGTFTLSPETFMNAIFEFCKNLNNMNIKKVLILNGHSGNADAIRLVGYRIKGELEMKVAAISYWDIMPRKVIEDVLEEKKYAPSGFGGVAGHAGEFETSIAMVIHPDLVREDLIPKWSGTVPEFLKGEILYYSECRPDGINLDPSLGTLEKGKICLNTLINELEIYIKRFKESS